MGVHLGNDGVNILVGDGPAAAAEHHLGAIANHGQQVVLVHRGLVVGEPPLLDDHGVQLQLLEGLLYHLQARGRAGQ